MFLRMSTNKTTDDDNNHDESYTEGQDEPTNRGWFRTLLWFCTLSPSDMLMLLQEAGETIDFDSPRAQRALELLGIVATVVFGILRVVQDNVIRPRSYRAEHGYADAFDFNRSKTLREYDYLLKRVTRGHPRISNSKSAALLAEGQPTRFNLFDTLTLLVNLTVGFMLLANLYLTYKFLFKQFRVYSLFNITAHKQSPNLSRHMLKGSNGGLYDPAYNGKSSSSFLSKIKRFMFKGSQVSSAKQTNETDRSQRFYYQLRKWTPSRAVTHLFVTFSPINIAILSFMEVSLASVSAIIIVTYLLNLIIKRYEVKLTDESIIYAAVNDEVRQKYLRPKLDAETQDVMVDATTHPNRGFVKFIPHTSKGLPIFRTHALTGEVVTERYNQKNASFEKVNRGLSTGNTIVESPVEFYMKHWKRGRLPHA